MSTVINAGPSGTASSSSGTPEKDNSQHASVADSTSDAPEGKQDKVEYDTYRKVLGEKKKMAERLNTLESERKEREEADLRAKEDYKRLLESRDKELEELRGKHSKLTGTLANGSKMRALFDALPGTVDKEFWDLMPVSMIELDPDTGLPDPQTVRNAAKLVETKYAKVLNRENPNLPPNDAARGTEKIDFDSEIRKAKTQKELDAVMKKYGKA